MCYRIFAKPDHGHTWLQVSKHESQAAALAELERLSEGHRPNKFVIRNTRGEIVARAASAPLPAASTWWSSQQLSSV